MDKFSRFFHNLIQSLVGWFHVLVINVRLARGGDAKWRARGTIVSVGPVCEAFEELHVVRACLLGPARFRGVPFMLSCLVRASAIQFNSNVIVQSSATCSVVVRRNSSGARRFRLWRRLTGSASTRRTWASRRTRRRLRATGTSGNTFSHVSRSSVRATLRFAANTTLVCSVATVTALLSRCQWCWCPCAPPMPAYCVDCKQGLPNYTSTV